MRALDWNDIDDAVYAIYDAQDQLSLRVSFLKICERLIPHRISTFDLKGVKNGEDVYFDPVSLNTPKEYLEAYYRYYIKVDYTSWVQQQPGNRPVYRDSDFVNTEVRRKSELYQGWLQPLGVDCGCSAIISYGDVEYGSVTLLKSLEDGDFSDEELDILATLARHLAHRLHQLVPNGFEYGKHESGKGSLRERYRLTEREVELARLICSGSSIGDIAEVLSISRSTVNRHISNIYKKVGVSSRYELTRMIVAQIS